MIIIDRKAFQIIRKAGCRLYRKYSTEQKILFSLKIYFLFIFLWKYFKNLQSKDELQQLIFSAPDEDCLLYFGNRENFACVWSNCRSTFVTVIDWFFLRDWQIVWDPMLTNFFYSQMLMQYWIYAGFTNA